jgi:DNA-directed RNA polymerase specialized sigma24 family protein
MSGNPNKGAAIAAAKHRQAEAVLSAWDAGFSQDAVGETAGASASTVKRILSGARDRGDPRAAVRANGGKPR